MSRIRTVKPSFWKHEDLSALPEATHMLAAALLNYADDDGYFNANPKLIQAECCPLREPSVSIHDSLIHLSNIGWLRLGNGSDGKRYGHILTFCEHQVINRKTDSKIKDMDIVWEDSRNTHGVIMEPSVPEGKGREGNKEGKFVRANVDKEFQNFLLAYPKRKGSRGTTEAKQLFERALKSGVPPATIIEAAKKFAEQEKKNIGTEFIPMPTKWLRREMWRDFAPEPRDEEAEAAREADMAARGYVWNGEKWVNGQDQAQN